MGFNSLQLAVKNKFLSQIRCEGRPDAIIKRLSFR